MNKVHLTDLTNEMIYEIISHLDLIDYRNTQLASKLFHVDTDLQVKHKLSNKIHIEKTNLKSLIVCYNELQEINNTFNITQFIQSIYDCPMDKIYTICETYKVDIHPWLIVCLSIHKYPEFGYRGSSNYIVNQYIKYKELKEIKLHINKGCLKIQQLKTTPTNCGDLANRRINTIIYSAVDILDDCQDSIKDICTLNFLTNKDLINLLNIFIQYKIYHLPFNDNSLIDGGPITLFTDLINYLHSYTYKTIDEWNSIRTNVSLIQLQHCVKEIDPDMFRSIIYLIDRLMSYGCWLDKDMITLSVHSENVFIKLIYPTEKVALSSINVSTCTINNHFNYQSMKAGNISINSVPWIDHKLVYRILNTAWGLVSNNPAVFVLYNKNMIISGGVILWAILASMGKVDPKNWFGSDWDLYQEKYNIKESTEELYIRNQSPYSITYSNNINEILQNDCIGDNTICKETEKRAELINTLTCSSSNQIILIENDVTYLHRHIQIIGLDYPIETVTEYYDLSAVQMYWNGKQVFASLSSLYSILHDVCFYHERSNPYRIEKYRNRGFTMIELPFENNRRSSNPYEPRDDHDYHGRWKIRKTH